MRRATLLALAIAVSLVATASAGTQGHRVAVFFLHGEQLGRTTRPGTHPVDAMRQLLAGPTETEARDGFRTYIPSKTPLRRLSFSRGVATVDLGRRFIAGHDRREPPRTAVAGRAHADRAAGCEPRAAAGRRKARLGRLPRGRHEQADQLRLPEQAEHPRPQPPPERLKPPDPHVKAAQMRLIAIGYLLKGDADGRFGPVTATRFSPSRSGSACPARGCSTPATDTRLTTAVRPRPVTLGRSGRRAEVLLDRQVTLLIEDNAVVRAIAVSTGKPSTPTPPGDYRVYAKIPKWWSTPFREWLPLAIPFKGGIAFTSSSSFRHTPPRTAACASRPPSRAMDV